MHADRMAGGPNASTDESIARMFTGMPETIEKRKKGLCHIGSGLPRKLGDESIPKPQLFAWRFRYSKQEYSFAWIMAINQEDIHSNTVACATPFINFL